MDEKISGMADFKESSDFARTLNVTLQEKMLEANQERAAALFTKQKCDEIATEVFKTEDTKPKQGSVSSTFTAIDKFDEEMLQEEISQMEKAIKVLMGEYANRKRIRDRTKAAAGQVTKRVAALMIFTKKKETFSKIRQTQIDEIQAYQKKKEEYHKQQQEIEKQQEKEKELQKEKELEERKKRESQSNMNRERLESNTSDDGVLGECRRGSRKGRLGRLDSVDDYYDDEDVFGDDLPRGRKNVDVTKSGGIAGIVGAKRLVQNKLSKGSASEDADLGRKDSVKEKGKKGNKDKGKSSDMSRVAHTIQGVFYWDRQQNQKTNSTFTGR